MKKAMKGLKNWIYGSNSFTSTKPIQNDAITPQLLINAAKIKENVIAETKPILDYTPTKFNEIKLTSYTSPKKDVQKEISALLNEFGATLNSAIVNSIVKAPLYAACKEFVFNENMLSLEDNQLLKQINDHLIKHNHHEYIMLNLAHGRYLTSLLNSNEHHPNLIYYLLHCRNKKLIESFSISSFNEHVHNIPVSEIILMIKLANEVEKNTLGNILYDKLTNYNDAEAAEMNEAICKDKERNNNAILLNFIPKDGIYDYLDKMLKSLMIDHTLQLNPAQKIELSYNLLNHTTIYFTERAKLLVESIKFTQKLTQQNNPLWKELSNIYKMIYYYKDDHFEFNTFCKQCIANSDQISSNEQMQLITFLILNNHSLLQYPSTIDFINKVLQKPINELMPLKRRIFQCYSANKLLFKNVVEEIMSQLENKPILTETDQLDILLGHFFNQLPSKYHPLIVKSFPIINKDCFKFMRISLNCHPKYLLSHNFDIISNMTAKRYSHPLNNFCRKFNLIYYHTSFDVIHLASLVYIIDNPQLIVKVINTNINFNFYSRASLGLINLKTSSSNKEEFLKSLIRFKTLFESSTILYAIMLCKDGKISANEVRPYFDFFQREHPEFAIPLFLYFSHMLDLNLYTPNHFLQIKTRKIIIPTIRSYCLVRPYLNNLPNIKEYDDIIINLINGMQQPDLLILLKKMSLSFGNSNYYKPIVKYIFEKNNNNYYGILISSALLKCCTPKTMKTLFSIASCYSRDLLYQLKVISYWGSVSEYTKMLSIIMNEPIVDVEGNTLAQSFCKGKNSDILFYMLNIPIIREYVLKCHKDAITKCLELSQNWNLFMYINYVLKNEAISIDVEIASQIKKDIEESKYIFQCIMNDDFDKDMDALKLGSQLYFTPTNGDVRFPYYLEQK